MTPSEWRFKEKFAYPFFLFDHIHNDGFGNWVCEQYLSNLVNFYSEFDRRVFDSSGDLMATCFLEFLESTHSWREGDRVFVHYSMRDGAASSHFFEVLFEVFQVATVSSMRWADADFDRNDPELRGFLKTGEWALDHPDSYRVPERSWRAR